MTGPALLETHWIAQDGLRFPVLATGAGLPVLFLHGGGSRAAYFTELMLKLGTAFRAIAYDQRGFAGTLVGEGDVVDHAHWASDAIGIMDALGIERAALVGWSMGASVAINAAFGWPERVERLVLLGGPDPERGVDVARLRARQAEAERLTPAETRLRDAAEIRANLGPAARADAALLDHLLDDRAATPPERIGRAIAGYATRPDLMERLPAIHCPVTLIGGTEDGISTPDVTHRLAATLPQAEIAMLDGCGHYHVAEQPEAVARILSAALRGDSIR